MHGPFAGTEASMRLMRLPALYRLIYHLIRIVHLIALITLVSVDESKRELLATKHRRVRDIIIDH